MDEIREYMEWNDDRKLTLVILNIALTAPLVSGRIVSAVYISVPPSLAVFF